MCYYTFHIEGIGRASQEFHADDQKAEDAAFETALEVSRDLGHLVFVTVRDGDGEIVCVAPRLSRDS